MIGLRHLIKVEYRGAVATGVNAVDRVAGANDSTEDVIVVERRSAIERHGLLHYEALSGNAWGNITDCAIQGVRMIIATPPVVIIVPPVIVILAMLIPVVIIPVVIIPVGMAAVMRVPWTGLRTGLRMPRTGLGTGLRMPRTGLGTGLRMPRTRLRAGLRMPRTRLRAGLRMPRTRLRAGTVMMPRTIVVSVSGLRAGAIMVPSMVLWHWGRWIDMVELPAAGPTMIAATGPTMSTAWPTAMTTEFKVINQCVKVTTLIIE